MFGWTVCVIRENFYHSATGYMLTFLLSVSVKDIDNLEVNYLSRHFHGLGQTRHFFQYIMYSHTMDKISDTRRYFEYYIKGV